MDIVFTKQSLDNSTQTKKTQMVKKHFSSGLYFIPTLILISFFLFFT